MKKNRIFFPSKISIPFTLVECHRLFSISLPNDPSVPRSSCTDAISNNLIKDRSSLFRHLNSERVKLRPEKKLRNKKGGGPSMKQLALDRI